MKNSQSTLSELKIGGIRYDMTDALLGTLAEGLHRSVDLLSMLHRSLIQGDESSRDQIDDLTSSISKIMDSVTHLLNRSSLDENELDQSVRSFISEIDSISRKSYSSTVHDVSPSNEYIPGAQQTQSKLDTEKFSSGIFRKQSDHVISPNYMRVITQSNFKSSKPDLNETLRRSLQRINEVNNDDTKSK